MREMTLSELISMLKMHTRLAKAYLYAGDKQQAKQAFAKACEIRVKIAILYPEL
jgi:Tfp pilus assembly protein PilF